MVNKIERFERKLRPGLRKHLGELFIPHRFNMQNTEKIIVYLTGVGECICRVDNYSRVRGLGLKVLLKEWFDKTEIQIGDKMIFKFDFVNNRLIVDFKKR